jgi:hypothetical protein
MEKLQQLELMDKIQRELADLQKSQTAILKKVSQISAHNITLGSEILNEKLPDLEDKVNASVGIVTELAESFGESREKFFSDNKLAGLLDPTAK